MRLKVLAVLEAVVLHDAVDSGISRAGEAFDGLSQFHARVRQECGHD